MRVPIPDALLLDRARNPFTLLQLAEQQPVILVFVTCACPSTYSTWQLLPGWAERLPQVRVLGVETSRLGDLDLPGVADRLYYDPLGRAYAALRMPGTSSAILLGADRLVAGGPVVGDAEIEEFVTVIASAFAEAWTFPDNRRRGGDLRRVDRGRDGVLIGETPSRSTCWPRRSSRATEWQGPPRRGSSPPEQSGTSTLRRRVPCQQ